ncbi:sulfur carrier protein ThiS [Bradyrhizobium sp. USDA 4503]
MADLTAETARLMKVTEAIVAELDRQGVAEAVADLGFDPLELARVVIRAADGDVVPGSKAADLMHLTDAPARLTKVAEAIVREMNRRGVADILEDEDFDVMKLARVVIRAADGDVVPFRRP